MSDAQARTTAARRNPLPFFAAAVLLAFLAGLALMGLAAQRWRWAVPVARPTVAPTPVVVTPHPTPVTVAPAPVPAPATATGAADPSTLAAREAILSAQIASLEARLAGANADASAAGARAGRAEAVLLAIAARRALDRGLGLGGLEAPFRARFAGVAPRPAALVIAAARQPVTLTDLRTGLDALAPALVAGGTGWWRGVRGALGSLVVVHRADEPSPAPCDRLARARRLVDAGQVEAALTEVGQLPGAAQAVNWTAAARRWADAHRALDQVEAVALAAPPPLPATPAGSATLPTAR